MLGVARVVTGQFTTIELVLTGFIAGFSIVGIVASARQVEGPSWSHRARVACVFALFAAFQVGAMWVALLPGIAYR